MITKSIKWVALVSVLAFSSSAMAYGSKYTSDGCKKPRFKSFEPAAYTQDTKLEAEAESEISFTVSGDAEPGSIHVVAKKIPLKFEIEHKDTFYEVTAKLPAELSGKYARISVDATAMMGCLGKDGWLIKIKKAAAAEE
ncbi:MAG: hypothetical protein PSN04_06185 [Methyloprofundus sp.]|nr:hypothetical protein [Methyloprofundus sp.]